MQVDKELINAAVLPGDYIGTITENNIQNKKDIIV
jgi:hypothetical protein